MSLLTALLLLFTACVAIDAYRRIVPGTRGIMVCGVGAVLIVLWLLLSVLGVGGNVRV